MGRSPSSCLTSLKQRNIPQSSHPSRCFRSFVPLHFGRITDHKFCIFLIKSHQGLFQVCFLQKTLDLFVSTFALPRHFLRDIRQIWGLCLQQRFGYPGTLFCQVFIIEKIPQKSLKVDTLVHGSLLLSMLLRAVTQFRGFHLFWECPVRSFVRRSSKDVDYFLLYGYNSKQPG